MPEKRNKFMKKEKFIVILFYKFAKIKNPATFAARQKKLAAKFNLKGRMLVAPEGVNATFEATQKNIKGYLRELKKQAMFKKVVFKQSPGNGLAFTKLMVKPRPETVTLGVGELNVPKNTSKMLTPAQLNKLYDKKEDFVILDLRNDYEIEAGYFEGTINPKLKFFRELPEKIKELEHLKHKKVVTVCTGDIRCEKGTCLLKKEGFTNLYQLKDGIHTYMQKYPAKHFKGTLFVFDNRMTTTVVPAPGREIVAKCKFCNAPCEEFYNEDSVRPSRKVICCDTCIVKHKKLRRCIPSGQ